MSLQPAITVKHLSKLYQLGRKRSGSFRETVSGKIGGLFRRNNNADAEATNFWALDDVSFEVYPGEVIGIIGKNGAGKSTLLKILSRITPPTKGKVEINGRVSSLLEVGTGFHPELSGRENIFMNGAILGMKRVEIRSKFDEIVAFSGIEKFIDTPVKRYSSGMYVRLAFAVAAHLEPEILIIDEVLAVGDAEFQKKCLGKMKDVSEQDGRTVLFVSHNIDMISTLCTRGMLFRNGKITETGNVQTVIEKYTSHLLQGNKFDAQELKGIFHLADHPSKKNKSSGMQLVKSYCDEIATNELYTGCKFKFEVFVKDYSSSRNIVLGFVLKDHLERSFVAINNNHLNIALNSNGNHDFMITFEIAPFLLYGQEDWLVDLYLGDGISDFEILHHAFHLKLATANFYHSPVLPDRNLNKIVLPNIFAAITPTPVLIQ